MSDERLASTSARLRALVRADVNPGDPQLVARLVAELRLPELYAAFLLSHHSKVFAADFVLGWRGVSLLLLGADGLEQAQGTYASDAWPERWVVIGFEYEGCYFIDTDTGAVGYLDHGVGYRHQDAGRDFVEFLEQVIEASQRLLAVDED